jgi:transposase
MPLGTSRLRLTPLGPFAPRHRAKRRVRAMRPPRHAIISAMRRARVRLAKLTSPRSISLIASPIDGRRCKGCSVKKPVGTVLLSSAEGEALIAQVHQSNLPPADAGMVEQIIRMYFWLVFALQEAKLSVKQLRTLLFGKSPGSSPWPEASSAPTQADGDETSASALLAAEAEVAARAEQAPPVAARKPEQGTPKGGHRPGTGRLGASAYTGATRTQCRHEELAVGQRCPVCGQGTLYALPAGVEIRLDGNALLSAMRYEVEKLRCSACGEIFTAGLPAGVGAEKYSPQARAVLAVSRYYLGIPGYRLQGYQAMLGVPVPDATQWDQIEVVGDCAYKVFEQMEHEAAQGELIFHDDTAVRILALLKDNRDLVAAAQAQGLSTPQERTGMHTTALAVQVGEHTAILYYSSRRHAGENLQGLLDKREAGLAKPLAMSDALVSNEVADESLLIRCHCLAHGRRKFSDLAEVFPHECQVVLEVIRQVFEHDAQARQEQLSPSERLAYHQRLSGPLMEGLHTWLHKQVDDRLVEPNSALGKAIAYLQGHWATLTQFLHHEGAPLDNNFAERALKLFIRQRNNSLFFATEHSAYIASVLTSLIATCIAAGGNAVEYLVALQEHRREVFADPAAWLPWAYANGRASP